MAFPSRLKALTVALMLAGIPLTSQAVLERVGPASAAPTIGGFPVWYQDTTGLTLEFCDPKNQAEVDGGWCLLLPADVTIPESFPANFFDEHFYFAARATINLGGGTKALLVTALESAFATGPAVPGNQIVFARIRVKLTGVPVTGTYRFIHPWGEELVDGVAGSPTAFTEDIGIGAPGDFSGALTSRLGPFLLPSLTPGGAELQAVAGPAGLYIADPLRRGPVTGSTLPNFIDSSGQSRNHNIFRVEGPVGSNLGGVGIDFIETSDFDLMGRVFTGVMPGQVDVKRANYSRNAAGNKVEVFADAFPTVQSRMPAAPRPAVAAPQLSFYAAPCAGTVDPATGEILPPYSAPAGVVATVMLNNGNEFWGFDKPAALPAAVCVNDSSARDALGNLVPIFVQKPVTDLVTISSATYDAVTGTLAVAATSSDAVAPPALTLAFGTQLVPLANGQASVSPLAAPPAVVTVHSSALGTDTAQVDTGAPAAAPPVVNQPPVVANDSYAMIRATTLNVAAPGVLANDSDPDVGDTLTVAKYGAPAAGGTFTGNADGSFSYTPPANFTGQTKFSYVVRDNRGLASQTAGFVLISVSNNRAPVTAGDAVTTLANTPVTIDVLGNDSDPDTVIDPSNTINPATVFIPATGKPNQGGTVTVNANGTITYAPAPGFTGIETFSYAVRDTYLTPAISKAATVQVTVQ